MAQIQGIYAYFNILTKKSTKRKRPLRSPDLVETVDTPAVRKLLPYI